MTQVTPPAVPATAGDIVARPSFEYRLRRTAVALILIGAGLWCVWDGFFVWPAQNEKALADRQPERHDRLSVLFQQGLAILLPPAGVAVLIWTLRTSRGAYRLTGTTLSIPGHPPFTLDNVRKIDKRLWDRKGIAYLEYELPTSSQRHQVKLDDFAYQREPTDRILERIEAHVRALA